MERQIYTYKIHDSDWIKQRQEHYRHIYRNNLHFVPIKEDNDDEANLQIAIPDEKHIE